MCEFTITPTWILTTFSYFSCSGSLWNEPSAKSYVGQKQPMFGSTYLGGLPPAIAVLKSVLSKITKPVTLLDITTLSLLLKDGHPSIYGLGGPTAMDQCGWYRTGTGRYVLYQYIYQYRNTNVHTGLNIGHTGHVPAILANFGQYRPVHKKKFFFFI